MSAERVCVIVNPAAGRGRGARMIPEITARFGELCAAEVRVSAGPGDERTLAGAAIAEGFTTLVAVGGDGTTSNIADAILHSGSDARLAVMPAGTGNDFAKLLGTAKADAATVARLCADPRFQRVDAGKIENVYFVNCCGFGFDVAVLDGIAAHPRLRGNLVYLYTALSKIFTYRGLEIGVRSSLSTRRPERHMLLVIANASNFGGAFAIAPGASAVDGRLDAVSILDVPVAKRFALLASVIRGKHERFSETRREAASEFEVSFETPPVYETDGELHHAQSPNLRISSCPAALRVVAAHSLS